MRRILFVLFLLVMAGPSFSQPPETLLQTARQLVNRGELEKARKLYELVLQKDPDRYIAAFRLAEIYEARKDYRKSLAYLNTAMDIARRFEEMAEEDTTGAAEEWNQQRFEERLATLYHYQGSLRNRLGEPRRALESFERSLELAPPNASLYTDKGIAYAQLEQNEEAVTLYLKAMAADSLAEESYYNLAILRQKEQAYEVADSLLKKALQVAPKAIQGYLLMGNLQLELTRFDKAIDYYTQAVELDSASEEAYFQRGVAYSRLQEHSAAEEDWTHALAVNPDNGDSYRNRGIVRLRQQKYSIAEADFDRAFALLGQISNLYLNRGYARLMQEQPEAALEDFEQAIALDSSGSDVYLLVAATHKKLKNRREACHYYQMALERGADPQQVEKWFRKKCR